MTRGDIVTVATPNNPEKRQAFFLCHREKGLADIVLDNGGIRTVLVSDLASPEEHGPLTLVSMIIAGVWSFLVGLGVGWWIGS